jgi:dephospho-CoA kinase|tara:strand:+ start:174 stop:791 length:618 start_codon:yes stop_codon:yes gene_type:complete
MNSNKKSMEIFPSLHLPHSKTPRVIVGVCGLRGSGKTTLANALCERSMQSGNSSKVLNFADPLKAGIKPLFLFSDEQLHGSLKEAVDERWGISPRRAMQRLATEFLRDTIDKDFFIKHLLCRITDPNCNYVIADVRFKNEQEALKKAGAIIVRLNRIGLDTDEHSSEKSIDPTFVDIELGNNGSCEELCNQCIVRLEKFIGRKFA